MASQDGVGLEVSPTSTREDVNPSDKEVEKKGMWHSRKPLRNLDGNLNAAPGEGSSSTFVGTHSSSSNTSNNSNSGGGLADISKPMGCAKERVSLRNGTLPLPGKLPSGRNPGGGNGWRNEGNPGEHVSEAEAGIEMTKSHEEDHSKDQGDRVAEGTGVESEGQHQRQEELDLDLWQTVSGSSNPGEGGSQASHGERSSADGDKVNGFHDSICLGFAVALCLNLGSVTARQKGFFAAEVKCLPQGSLSNLLDLGVWVGWRRAVVNSNVATSFDLEELSVPGAIMGILTVVGHSADSVVNALGFIILLCTRRKRIKREHSRAIKILCLAALGMAGWLLGMTVIGFLVAVEGSIGSAAIAFYSREFDLDCDSSVSVSVDYAYAMTTLTILCQFFIGIIALPRPPRWCPWSCKRRGTACSSAAMPRARAEEASPGRGCNYYDPPCPGPSEEGQSLPAGGMGGKGEIATGGLDRDMLRNSICDPV